MIVSNNELVSKESLLCWVKFGRYSKPVLKYGFENEYGLVKLTDNVYRLNDKPIIVVITDLRNQLRLPEIYIFTDFESCKYENIVNSEVCLKVLGIQKIKQSSPYYYLENDEKVYVRLSWLKYGAWQEYLNNFASVFNEKYKSNKNLFIRLIHEEEESKNAIKSEIEEKERIKFEKIFSN